MFTGRNVCVALVSMMALLAGSAVVHAEEKAADASGKWSWEVPGRQGGEARKVTLKLKQEGEKASGTITGFGGDELEIQDGKIKDGELTFKVVRKRNDREFTTAYSGKISGDEIKGKSTSQFNDQTRERDWTAKRVKDEEKK